MPRIKSTTSEMLCAAFTRSPTAACASFAVSTASQATLFDSVDAFSICAIAPVNSCAYDDATLALTLDSSAAAATDDAI